MENFRPGDIVLLAFPYADATGIARRPALVLLDTGDADIVAARITSQPARDSLDLEIGEWRAAGLLLRSTVRVHKVATLEKRLVQRKLGVLAAVDWIQVREAIQRLWTSI